MENKDRAKRGFLVAVLILFVLLGIVASAGAMNYGHFKGEWLYYLSAPASLVAVVYAAVAFYRKYLKP